MAQCPNNPTKELIKKKYPECLMMIFVLAFYSVANSQSLKKLDPL